MATEQAGKVAELNNAFRRSGTGVVFTMGVQVRMGGRVVPKYRRILTVMLASEF